MDNAQNVTIVNGSLKDALEAAVEQCCGCPGSGSGSGSGGGGGACCGLTDSQVIAPPTLTLTLNVSCIGSTTFNLCFDCTRLGELQGLAECFICAPDETSEFKIVWTSCNYPGGTNCNPNSTGNGCSVGDDTTIGTATGTNCHTGLGVSESDVPTWRASATLYCVTCNGHQVYLLSWSYNSYVGGIIKETHGVDVMTLVSNNPITFAHYNGTLSCDDTSDHPLCGSGNGPISYDLSTMTNCVGATVDIDLSE